MNMNSIRGNTGPETILVILVVVEVVVVMMVLHTVVMDNVWTMLAGVGSTVATSPDPGISELFEMFDAIGPTI